MAYVNQQFFGSITAQSINNQNIVILEGNFAAGSPTISSITYTGDPTLLRISQSVFSVAGAIPTSAYITAFASDYTSITLSENAVSNATDDTIGFSTPSGSYLVTSASFVDPQNKLSVLDITGSVTGSPSSSFAVLAQAKSNNATVTGRQHVYNVSEVVQRDIQTAKLSFFIEWGEDGIEADSGDTIQTAETNIAIVDLTTTGSLSPEFSKATPGLEGLPIGSDFAGFNIGLNQYFTLLSGSTGGGGGGAGTSGTSGTSGTAGTSGTSGATYKTTSTTALTVTTGLKTLTLGAGLAYSNGMFVIVTPNGLPSIYMLGNVTAYNASTGVLTFNCTELAGSGTYTNWIINLSGQSGGTSGTSGTSGAGFDISGSTSSGLLSLVRSGSDAVRVNQDLTFVTSSGTTSSLLTVVGDIFVQGTLSAATKNFKINHPTMPGYYLVHSSLEGPEKGIYYRGKLKTNHIIHLPDYWTDLTDDVDITVQLTPIGNACQHFVKSVTKSEIEVGCECGIPHCYYIVHAQRYDQGKLNILEPKNSIKL